MEPVGPHGFVGSVARTRNRTGVCAEDEAAYAAEQENPMTLHPEISTIQPEDPALAVQLEAKPPVVETRANGDVKHGQWTLDLLERTMFEFRAAGGWDGAVLTLNNGGWREGGTVKCEILAGRGADAMPWGWRPSQGPPTPPRPELLPDPVVTKGGSSGLVELLGNRVLHGLLLLVLVALAVVR
jgi:hypothetical protein